MATNFPPPKVPFIRARHSGGAQRPKAIVLHGTVSSDNKGTALNIANWWAGPSSPVTSAHYVVDPGVAIQCVGDHTVAYHCGYNQDTIGVEFCDEQAGPANRWRDDDSDAILKRAARLVAELCLAYDIDVKRPSISELRDKGPHGIYGHNDSRLAFGYTSHTDPRDFPWDYFIELVRAEARALREGSGKTFKVLHAPLHGVSATRAELRAALKRPGVIAVAFSEAYRKGRYLGRRPRWRAVMGSDIRRDERGRLVERDVVVLVRKRFKMIRRRVLKACDASLPLRIAPERFLAYSVNEVYGRKTAFISLHPHAVVKDHWNTDRAARYRDSMQTLGTTIRQLREIYDEIDIVVLGDLNYPDVDDDRSWTPRWVAERYGLSWYAKGIDWVLYSKGLELVDKPVVVDKSENGQDHPWLEAEFRQV